MVTMKILAFVWMLAAVSTVPETEKVYDFKKNSISKEPTKEIREDVELESFFEEPEDQSVWPKYYYDMEEKKETPVEATSRKPMSETIGEKKELPADYRLKIGDRLYVSLYGFTEGNTVRTVIVDPTGRINYLFIDPVPALGRTIDDVRHEMQAQVTKQYPNVVVTISALELFGDQYTIMGEVQLPGTRQLTGNTTLLKAIGAAGGFPLRVFRNQTIDYADLDRAFLSRNGDYVPIDFRRLVREGDTSQDIVLQGGDYIYIPPLTFNEIYIVGEVRRALVYSYIQPASLLEVITWAGGTSPIASSRIAVIRGSLYCPITYLVDINLIQKGCAPDFPLCPGDIVYVPPERFANLKQIIKDGIRVFVGAIAVTGGEQLFNTWVPQAADINNNNIIFNPGLISAPVSPGPIVVP